MRYREDKYLPRHLLGAALSASSAACLFIWKLLTGGRHRLPGCSRAALCAFQLVCGMAAGSACLSVACAAAPDFTPPAAADSLAAEDSTSPYVIYYLNENENGLYNVTCLIPDSSFHSRLQLLFQMLATVPNGEKCYPLLPDNVSILSYSFKDGLLTLNLSPSYHDMDSIREVLARAGIVRTLVQLSEVDNIRFFIDGSDAVTCDGVQLGIMNADSFVEDAGKTINAIQNTTINLFFATESGDSLVRESRSIYYSSSKPLEWAIVERIIAGPLVPGNHPTVPSNMQILGVTTSNGTCYVNLSSAFVTNQLMVSEQVPVYSIVNSICDNCHDIKEVQFAIDGDSNVVFRQSMDLSHPYQTDMSLVGQAIQEMPAAD